MKPCARAGAETGAIDDLLAALPTTPVLEAIEDHTIPVGARDFLRTTFTLIASGKPHALAAAFTFGREDVIPDMFRALVRDLSRRDPASYATFLWYLERHIEVDGEDHGPLSLRMVADICGNDDTRWNEAAAAAEAAPHRTPRPMGRRAGGHPHRLVHQKFSSS